MKALEIVKSRVNPLFTREFWHMIGEYLGIGRRRKYDPVIDQESLAVFVNGRASHVAQASLYGYLRTRAGTRFPQMFENQDLLTSINIAKWHVWLACLSDLYVFTGQYLRQSGEIAEADIRALIQAALQQVLDATGEPDEAGPDFAAARDKIVQRIATCDWSIDRDDDTVFSASPEALYYWSPIADELKERDESIVKNSIRYRWIEVRRHTRNQLDCRALAQSLEQSS